MLVDVPIHCRYMLVESSATFSVRVRDRITGGWFYLSYNRGRYTLDLEAVTDLQLDDFVSYQASPVSTEFASSVDGLPVNIVSAVTVETSPDFEAIVRIESAACTHNALFDALAPFVPNVGDSRFMMGYTSTGAELPCFSRKSATEITVFKKGVASEQITDGSGTLWGAGVILGIYRS